jgi:hypothetical protein
MTKKTIPEPAPVVNEPRQEWQRDALRAVPDALVRDIVSDAYRGISKSASMIPDKQRAAEEPRAASGGTIPVQQPAGVRWVDAQCDYADRQERIAAIRQRIENEWIEEKLDRSKPSKVRSEYNPIARHDAELPSFFCATRTSRKLKTPPAGPACG